jgi:hypothetical protein
MINYLTRRRTSVPYVNFMPPEMMAFGEAAIVRAFDAHPPDYVLIVERTTSEYGHAAFGADEAYGALLMSWIRARYRTVAGIGQHRPLPSEQPAHIVAMKRIR